MTDEVKQDEFDVLLKSAIDVFGKRSQLIKLTEECGELIQQAAKMANGKGDDDKFLEELADVSIMVAQFIDHVYTVEKFLPVLNKKIDRLKEIVEEATK
jgi:NTP pyrophosphatase (non-canonical NTP hydrolase)